MLISYKKSKNIFGWAFVSPLIIGFLLFAALPIGYSFVMSFYKYNFFTSAVFVGIDNYSACFSDKVVLMSIKNMFIALLGVPLSIAAALFVAFLLCRDSKGQSFYRTCFYIPVLCSEVAISVLWKTIFNKDYGVINNFLSVFGIQAIGWLTDKNYVMISLIIQSIWMGMGGGLILFIAALKGVPKSYIEAAEIDGAKGGRIFFRIIFPMISPTTFYIFITGIISTMSSFTIYKIMTDGGPAYGSMVPALYIYQAAFVYSDLGFSYSCALGWILGLLIMGITVVVFKVGSKIVNYEY